MRQEQPPIPHFRVCATCEKAHKGERTCDKYPDGIPKEYRRKVDGLPDETGTPACPDYEKEKDPYRWADPEWVSMIDRLIEEMKGN